MLLMRFPRKSSSWIMLISLVLILSSLMAKSATIDGLVNDHANVISQDYEIKIEGILKRLYDTKTSEFAVVTIDSLEGQDIESYALNLAQGKLGDKEKNNGLLLLVSVEDRKYRFEVGRGIEPIRKDAKMGRIGRNDLVDNFKGGEYGKGIYEASMAVSTTLLGENNSEYYVTDTVPRTRSGSGSSNFFSLFILFMIISSILGSIGKKNSTYRRRDRFFNAALMAGLLFGGRGRGGMGGGLGGGSFGGFGGGGFGGGGAGGSF